MLRISGGAWKGQSLKVPKGNETRPTSSFLRESIFNVIHNGMGRAPVRVLDLFAGSGSLGIEALSHGALSAVFVECAPAALKILDENILVAQGKGTLIVRDADPKKWPSSLLSAATFTPFDLIFCDPPYERGWFAKVFRALTPHAAGGKLWAPGALLVAEMSPKEALELDNWRFLKEKTHGDSKVVFLEWLK